MFNSFFSKSCIYTSVKAFVCWHVPHFQLNECLKMGCPSPRTDMPLSSKCWGDMKVLLRSGGDFDVNDVPQGTRPHSSWVRFYAQKCKIFSPCTIKLLQQSLPKPVSASVNSELLTKSQFCPHLWYEIGLYNCKHVLQHPVVCGILVPYKSWPCWCLVGISWWASLQNSLCSLPVLVRDADRGSNAIVCWVFQIKYTGLKFFWCP